MKVRNTEVLDRASKDLLYSGTANRNVKLQPSCGQSRVEVDRNSGVGSLRALRVLIKLMYYLVCTVSST
jgi:hypothetical protein